ncbi:MAG: hypothetical protein P4L74_03050 [Candidatus Doudnabacteria bacterium]|nr:hypothetical protein [Candidatus Doudnabacteria bacterium]
MDDQNKESTNLGLLALFFSPGVIAVYQRNRYRNCLDDINPRMITLLTNEKIFAGNKISYELSFNADRGILSILGQPVNIIVRKRDTNEHKLLKYIFANLDRNEQGFDFQEIAEKGFNHLGYLLDPDSSKRYYSACEEIQQKVASGTKYQVPDFLDFHSGDRAWVRINPKYTNK